MSNQVASAKDLMQTISKVKVRTRNAS